MERGPDTIFLQEAQMKTILFFAFFITSFNAFSGEWSIKITDTKTGLTVSKNAPSFEFGFTVSEDNLLSCTLFDVRKIIEKKSDNLLERSLHCSGEKKMRIVCEDLNYETGLASSEHYSNFTACSKEIQIDQYKISIEYWWM